jgi:hypothetical protein
MFKILNSEDQKEFYFELLKIQKLNSGFYRIWNSCI